MHGHVSSTGAEMVLGTEGSSSQVVLLQATHVDHIICFFKGSRDRIDYGSVAVMKDSGFRVHHQGPAKQPMAVEILYIGIKGMTWIPVLVIEITDGVAYTDILLRNAKDIDQLFKH